MSCIHGLWLYPVKLRQLASICVIIQGSFTKLKYPFHSKFQFKSYLSSTQLLDYQKKYLHATDPL